MKNGMRIWNIVCAILCVLLAGVIAGLFYWQNKQDTDHTAAIQAVLDEAKPYEDELEQCQTELTTLKKEITYSSDSAEILVGFVVTEAPDLEYISGKAEEYGFSPVLILDCTLEMETIEQILAEADPAWEIMLYATAFTANVNEDVLSVMDYLEEAGLTHSGIFLLRSDYSTQTVISLLKRDGFIGYTVYSDSPKSGQNADGTVYIDYSYLQSSGSSVDSRIAAMYGNKASMLYALDMASYHDGSLPESYVAELLNILQSYSELEGCTFSTVAEVVGELSAINDIEAANQASYDSQAAELEERIAELEEIIAAIYEKMPE